jgi:hypothetical protein
MITKKKKMPDGWVSITWKDKTGKKWVSNMPVSAYGHFQLQILSKGGIIVKEEF